MGPCPLLELAAELRNQIFALAVVEPEPQHLFLLDSASGGLRASFQQPALARVNRQIRSETLPIFYGQNVFRLDEDLPQATPGVQVSAIIKVPACKQVRSIVFRYNLSFAKESKDNAIGLQIDEDGALQYRVEGLGKIYCACALHSTLADLTRPRATESGKEGVITLPNAILSLYRGVVPGLKRSFGLCGKACSDCGKITVEKF
ncbi:hypothetical protein LTR27_008029 [Elasticomyces elasticus]|nr:hypothetical protein LTR27_008029 [Elasticomyces elasticus]